MVKSTLSLPHRNRVGGKWYLRQDFRLRYFTSNLSFLFMFLCNLCQCYINWCWGIILPYVYICIYCASVIYCGEKIHQCCLVSFTMAGSLKVQWHKAVKVLLQWGIFYQYMQVYINDHRSSVWAVLFNPEREVFFLWMIVYHCVCICASCDMFCSAECLFKETIVVSHKCLRKSPFF